ncbi:hypothetical protein AbauAttikon1_0015 [Acinetobacter phage Abau_Attikon1]
MRYLMRYCIKYRKKTRIISVYVGLLKTIKS